MKGLDAFKKELVSGVYDDRLKMLYGDPDASRYAELLECFRRSFGDGELRIISAPGRTELCGNHTDHQNGCVLAASVGLDMIAAVTKRPDSVVKIVSEGFGTVRVELTDLEPINAENGTPAAIIRGVAAGIRKTGFYKPGGFEAYIKSSVPIGSGLSSSAALEVLIGKIFSVLYCHDELSPVLLAQLGQRAENDFFGKPSGLMDQMACSAGGVLYADFSNPNEPKTEEIPFSFEQNGYALCITNSGGSHAGLTGEYSAITHEMERCARYLGVARLGQANAADFFESLPRMRGKVTDRTILRAMHFFTENERVKAQLQNLKNGDMQGYLAVMAESGKSSAQLLQNLWPADPSERSLALALAVSDRALAGKGVSRVHGGGFAGTIQALVPAEKAESYIAAMNAIFGDNACVKVRIRPVGAYELKMETV